QQQQQQQPPPTSDQPQPPPTFRTGINFVRVDVIITDKNGNALADLQPGDFEVTEDGKPQKIETFKLVKLDGGTSAALQEPPKEIRSDYDEESEAAKEDVRLFAIFLDDYHVRRGASMAVREPIAKFIDTQLGPSDMVGIMYPLESLASLRMTRNHDAIMKGIQQFTGRKFEYTPKNQFEEQYANYPAETVEQVRNQVSMTAIRGLITHLGSLKEGRKALILVSEGFSGMLPPQLRNPIATMPGYGNPNAGNPMAGVGDPNEDRAAWLSGLDLDSDLRQIYDTANKNNVAIYAVDPRGLAVNEFDIDQNVSSQLDRQYLNSTMDSLRVLSDQTDGRAIVNRNDLATAMKQIVRDTSAYYLIGYNSSQTPTDGKFHEIKVRVKRPGAQVRSRKGYWALTAEETARATAKPKPGPPKAVTDALASVSRPSRTQVIRTWIGTSRGENGKTKVTFVWEPVARTAADAQRDQPARVSLMAVGADGAPYFRGKIPEGVTASAAPAASGTSGSNGNGATPAGAPRASRVIFEVPPGKMELRVSVEGTSSQVLDTEMREVTVPDLTAPTTLLGTPAVYRARTVRELQQLKADPDAAPVALREFSRTDKLFVRVPAYAAGGSTPQLTARVLNRAGDPINQLPVAPPASPGGDPQIDLALSAFPPGEYILEIKAAGDGGPSDSRELVGFRIIG
ncbi:MAG TPA: VWA domain-containing protein, partial [Vicinamibacterales bacterium]